MYRVYSMGVFDIMGPFYGLILCDGSVLWIFFM